MTDLVVSHVCQRYRYCLCFIPSQSCVSEVSIMSLFYTKSVMCVRCINIVSVLYQVSHVCQRYRYVNIDTSDTHDWLGIKHNIDTSDTHDWLGIKQRQYRYLWHTVRGIDIVCFIPSQSCVSDVSILSLFYTKSVMCVRGIDIVSVLYQVSHVCQRYQYCLQRQYRYLWHTWLTWY
jgi:hypothetical protein